MPLDLDSPKQSQRLVKIKQTILLFVSQVYIVVRSQAQAWLKHGPSTSDTTHLDTSAFQCAKWQVSRTHMELPQSSIKDLSGPKLAS